MAKEWYLLKSPHSQLSGFESDAVDDFATEGFLELLDSDISVSVNLYNCDLTIHKTIKVIVQNNTQDTKLKTMSRMVLLPIGSCKAGMYIEYKERFWLIVGLVDNNTIYEKAIMVLCNYLLTWLNDKGVINQRWVNITSASQYNNGETDARMYFIRSDQLLILAPYDDESLLLHTGMRFIIDRRCKLYEKRIDINQKKCIGNPVITYKLTRVDSVLYDYQDSGHFEFLATQDEQHENDGYYIINGKGYWLCDTPNIDNKVPILLSKIECDSFEIYNGIDEGVFKAVFFDENGKEIETDYKWNIDCDFIEQLNIKYKDNSIFISVDNVKLINKSFGLTLSAEGYKDISIRVTIRAFI